MKNKKILAVGVLILMGTLLLETCFYIKKDTTQLKHINKSLKSNSDLVSNYSVSYDGIDVSRYQGNIDWKVVGKNNNIKFVYIKATEGKTYTDPKFKYNLINARKNGLKVGVYHFYSTQSSVEEQFRHLKKTVSRSDIDLIPMIDVEPGTNPTSNKKKKINKDIERLSLLIEAYYGKQPIIYATQRSYNEYLAPLFNERILYIGRYNGKKIPPQLIGGGQCSIWQYSETGKIKGIEKPVDLAALHNNFDISQLFIH